MATCAKTVRCGLLIAFWGLVACKSASDSDAVADGFVDAYYVEFDHARARTFATAGALRRIDQEEQLVLDARQQIQMEERKARVYYSDPVKREVGEDMVHYTYQLDIRNGDREIAQPVLVMLGKQDGLWKVIQFREIREVHTSTVGAP